MNTNSAIVNSLKLLNTKYNAKNKLKNIIKQYKNNDDKNPSSAKKYSKIKETLKGIIKNRRVLNFIIDNFYNHLEIKKREKFMLAIYRKFILNKKIENKLDELIKCNEDNIQQYLTESVSSPLDASSDNPENIMYCRVNFQKPDKPDKTDRTDRTDKIYKPNNEININTALKTFINDKNAIKDNLIDGLYRVQKRPKNFDRTLLNKAFEMRNSFDIVIQSKSSCLPAYILKLLNHPTYNKTNIYCDVIDTCSAPGNKTLQLSEYFPNSKIFAFEKNPRRFELLNKNVENCNFNSNIITENSDFLTLDPNDDKYSNVEIFLADPSCSGSGTSNNISQYSDKLGTECSLVLSEIEDDNIIRLKDFAKLQIDIIKHCMKFPKVKYISYSTCSVFKTEDEYVCEEILNYNKSFRLVDIFNIDEGFGNYHKGVTSKTEGSLRVCRKCHGEEGFYVAIFEKVE